MKVDLDALRKSEPVPEADRLVRMVSENELAALLAVVDAARAVRRVRVYGHPEEHALDVALERLMKALEPFAPGEAA